MAETHRGTSRTSWSPSRFVVLPENRSAVLAVRRLAQCLGQDSGRCSFVPLLLHGPPGSGKSHLVSDLFEWTLQRRSAQSKEAADWASLAEESYGELERCDLLIVEDLQYLSPRFADPFAMLLDRRIARRQATLLTANRGPAEFENLPARLASRLAGGLIVGLDALSLESRRLFLKKRCVAVGMAVTPEALFWLAQHTPGSARQLLGVLSRLRKLTAIRPDLLNLETVRVHFATDAGMSRPTVERITRDVAKFFRVRPRQVRGPDRQPGVLWPRQITMYLARAVTELSLAEIGEYFGRDHSTVRHACQKVADALETDAKLAAIVRQLRSEISA